MTKFDLCPCRCSDIYCMYPVCKTGERHAAIDNLVYPCDPIVRNDRIRRGDMWALVAIIVIGLLLLFVTFDHIY